MGQTNVSRDDLHLWWPMNDGFDLLVRFGAAAKNRFENGECNMFHCSAALK